MPAKSRKQQQLFAIAEHEPAKLYAKNKGLAKLPKQTLHEFAATKGLKKKGGKVARHTSKSNRGAEKPPSMGAGSAKRMISPGSNYHDGDSHGGRRGETIHLDNRGGHPGEGHKGHAKGSNEKYRDGHGQLLDEQKHWRDGIHQESGHTKRHTFHKIGHKLHADKMAHG